MQQFGDVVEIDPATLVQHHGERVRCAGDDWRRRRRNHALCEDRPGFGGVRVEIVVLDRGDQPAIGVIKEGLQVRPAMRLAHFAGLVVLGHRDRREIDRAEIAHEVRPGDAQTNLRILPRPVGFLAFEDLANRIADRDQLADDSDMPFGHALGAAALANLDRDRPAVEDLHDPIGLVGDVAAFAHMAIGRRNEIDGLVIFVAIGVDDVGLAVVDRVREKSDRIGKERLERLAGTRHAGIGLAEGTGRQRMRA